MDRSRITFLLCILLWCGLAAAQTGDPEPTTFTVTQSDYNGTLDADGQAMIASMTTTTNSGYTGTTKFSYVDITGTSCVVSNCWMGLTGSVNQMAAGGGAVFGNTGGQVWQLHPSSDTAQGYWTQTSLPLTKYIAVDSDGTLYGLIADSTCSSWPSTGRLAVANSALTAWSFTSPAKCLTNVSFGTNDGTVAGVNTDNGVLYSLLPGQTWTSFPVSGFAQVVVAESTVAYARKTAAPYAIQHLDLAHGTVVSTLPGSAVKLALGNDGILWEVALSGAISAYGTAQNRTGNVTIVGGASDIASGGYGYVFRLQGNTPNHLNQIGIQGTSTVTGYWQCPSIGCPAGSTHTATASIAVGTNTLKTMTDTGAPAATLNATAKDTGINCDIIFGNPTAPGCGFRVIQNVACSVMGLLFALQPNVQFVMAHTKSDWNGGIKLNSDYSANCNLDDWCSNTVPTMLAPFGNPPLAHFAIVNMRPSSPRGPYASCQPYYTLATICSRLKWGGVWTAWGCFPVALEAAPTQNPSFGLCTGTKTWWNSLGDTIP